MYYSRIFSMIFMFGRYDSVMSHFPADIWIYKSLGGRRHAKISLLSAFVTILFDLFDRFSLLLLDSHRKNVECLLDCL